MPTARISMRNLREILRLRLQAGLSLRQIQSCQRVSLGAVQRIASQGNKFSGADLNKLLFTQIFHLNIIANTGLTLPFVYQNYPGNAFVFLEAYVFGRLLL